MQTTGAVALTVGAISAFLVYQFDPVIGVAIGVLTATIAVIASIATRDKPTHEKPSDASGPSGWDEDPRS